MAVAFRSAASTNSGTGTGSTVTLTKPASTATDDVLIASLNVAGGTSIDITPPAGWTLIRRTDQTTAFSHFTYWKAAGGSEPANYAFSVVLVGTATASNRRYAASILSFTGASTTAPVHAEATQSTASDTTGNSAVVTTTAADCMLVHCYAARSTTGTVGGTTSHSVPTTERTDTQTTAATSPWLLSTTSTEPFLTPGTSTTRQATYNVDTVWRVNTIALQPPVAATNVTASGIASAEAFGTPTADTVDPSQEVTATAIGSAQAFGTATATSRFTATAQAIPTGEAFGTARITMEAEAQAVASSESFGTATATSVFEAQPDAIGSAEAIGTPAISLRVHGTGLPTSELIGSPTASQRVTAQAIGSQAAFGTATVAQVQAAAPSATVAIWPRTATTVLGCLTITHASGRSDDATRSDLTVIASVKPSLDLANTDAGEHLAVASQRPRLRIAQDA